MKQRKYSMKSSELAKEIANLIISQPVVAGRADGQVKIASPDLEYIIDKELYNEVKREVKRELRAKT